PGASAERTETAARWSGSSAWRAPTASPRSNPTNDPVTAERLAKSPCKSIDRLERRGGEEVELVTARRGEAVGVPEFQLRLEVVAQVQSEVGLDAHVGLQLGRLKTSLVGVARVAEEGDPHRAEVRRERFVAPFDPDHRRPVF